jgi:hypothetical protein
VVTPVSLEHIVARRNGFIHTAHLVTP